jgi:nicotinate-nucleotide adenylyltransferase
LETTERIGIFGGTFNPLHVGHLNSMVTVAKKVGLQKVVVVPTFQNPVKEPIEGPSPEQRLEMVEAGVKEYDGLIQVDDQEVKRGGNSFTIETLKGYADQYNPDDLFLIVGVDVFYGMDEWKDLEKILEVANLVVTTRSGNQLPYSLEDFPKRVRDLVADYDKKVAFLNSGRFIHFVRLEDIDVSATEVRKKLRNGQNVAKFLTTSVEEYIKEQGLYKPLDVRIANFEEFTRFCANVLY